MGLPKNYATTNSTRTRLRGEIKSETMTVQLPKLKAITVLLKQLQVEYAYSSDF